MLAHGAACTEFVCGNVRLERFIAGQLSEDKRKSFDATMKNVRNAAASDAAEIVLKAGNPSDPARQRPSLQKAGQVGIALTGLLFLLLIFLLRRKSRTAR